MQRVHCCVHLPGLHNAQAAREAKQSDAVAIVVAVFSCAHVDCRAEAKDLS